MESDDINLERFHEFKDRAEIYYAYDFIYRAMDEPFRSSLPSTLLNIGQFLLAKFAMREEMPLGVSLAYVLNTLAKHGEAMGAYKLARFAYSKLQGLRMPVAWQTQVDLASLITRSKPYADAEDLLPLCFRCTATNPLVSGKGDVCISCGGTLRSLLRHLRTPSDGRVRGGGGHHPQGGKEAHQAGAGVPASAVRRTTGAVIRG